MANVALDTVYPTYAAGIAAQGLALPSPGSLTIDGGTANVYFSNAETEPANAAAMTLDTGSPFTGVKEVVPGARWVLVEQVTGAPVVTDFRVIV